MLELAILKYAIRIIEESGRVGVSFKLTPFMRKFNVPRATFYRAINRLMETHFIVRIGQDKYILGRAVMPIIAICEGWKK